MAGDLVQEVPPCGSCGGRFWQVFTVQDWDGTRVKLRCVNKMDCYGFHMINLSVRMEVSP